MNLKLCNPCPCMELQSAVKKLAIFDAVITVINLILLIIGDSMALSDYPDESEKNAAITSMIIGILFAILMIFLAYRLFFAARDRNYARCKTWLYITLALTIVNLVLFIYVCAAGSGKGPYIAGAIIGIGYNVFEMSVVYAFMKELFAQNNYGYGHNPPGISHPNV